MQRLKSNLATSPRVTPEALAKELTAGIHQDYQKALAICLYLKRTYRC